MQVIHRFTMVLERVTSCRYNSELCFLVSLYQCQHTHLVESRRNEHLTVPITQAQGVFGEYCLEMSNWIMLFRC